MRHSCHILSKVLTSVILMVALAACRTNNGDIGPLYGLWALQDMTVDGERADIDYGNFFFRFQNNIVIVTETLEFNDFSNSFGTWTLADGRMVMNFSHTTDHSNMANLPPSLLMPSRGVLDCEVNTLTTKSLVLIYDNPEGKHIVYTLEKRQ